MAGDDDFIQYVNGTLLFLPLWLLTDTVYWYTPTELGTPSPHSFYENII